MSGAAVFNMLCCTTDPMLPNRNCRLCWSAGSASPVHSHGGSQCFIKVLEGSLHERTFAFPEEGSIGTPLRHLKSGVVSAGSVSFLNDEIGLHDVTVHERAMSLHVYVPGYEKVRLATAPIDATSLPLVSAFPRVRVACLTVLRNVSI